MALDPATGGQVWSRQLGQYSFSSEPSAQGEEVFVGGAGSGGTVYGVDGGTGAVRWSASVCCGDHSSPALADGRLFVGYACHNNYGFNAASGALLWNSNDGCTGGGGKTHWMLCPPERKPDEFGRPTEIERICGQREIPRGI
jgi:outer membrane protein assembly factor BamB